MPTVVMWAGASSWWRSTLLVNFPCWIFLIFPSLSQEISIVDAINSVLLFQVVHRQHSICIQKTEPITLLEDIPAWLSWEGKNLGVCNASTILSYLVVVNNELRSCPWSCIVGESLGIHFKNGNIVPRHVVLSPFRIRSTELWDTTNGHLGHLEFIVDDCKDTFLEDAQLVVM